MGSGRYAGALDAEGEVRLDVPTASEYNKNTTEKRMTRRLIFILGYVVGAGMLCGVEAVYVYLGGTL